MSKNLTTTQRRDFESLSLWDHLSAKFILLGLLLIMTNVAFAAGGGIPIVPDQDANFKYADDFFSPRLFSDAFETNIPNRAWQSVWGEILYRGRKLSLTYRFYGDRMIEQAQLQVEQSAKPEWGGRNQVFLSSNGRDWTLVASSEKQEVSEKQRSEEEGWQRDPLVVSPADAAKFTGTPDLWVRIELDNTSDKKFENISNRVSSIEVKLKVGAKTQPIQLPTSDRDRWGKFLRKYNWNIITLDGSDPIDHRPPHYYEDSDGWLQVAGANPYLIPNETEGFPIRRDTSMLSTRFPLSMAMFVKTKRLKEPMMAKIIVRRGPKSSEKMNVLWDGKLLESFNIRSDSESEKAIFVEIPSPQRRGIHEFRIAGGDRAPIFVRQVALTGPKSPQWVEKPALRKGGSLQVLSASYMPDPKPFEGSQVVEGRHESRPVGQTFRPLQRMYKEHADFGGLRIVLRNNSRVLTRIANILLLNGKPIEDSYISFTKSDWDARGVVWYRIWPKTLQPGQCAELYIRFRRRPEGEHANVTIPLENGKPLKMRIPYINPGLVVDYVTTGKSPDTLYVYARRTTDAKVGKLKTLMLDGKKLRKVDVYGADFPGNVALVVAKLKKPLELGSRHVVGITTTAGKSEHAEFKVLPFFFPRSSFTTPSSIVKDHHMNITMWTMRSLEECEKYDLFTTTRWGGDFFRAHERVRYIVMYDEPDAHDHGTYWRFGNGVMGLGARGRWYARTGWQQLMDRFAPKGAASWAMINGTSRPLNWAVYGQWGDIMSTDPYTVMGYDADHTVVREELLMARVNSTPRRLYATLEAFGFKPGVGTPDWQARGPIPAEYRQDVVQAIGCGMKGLTSWVYQRHLAGWQLDDPAAKAVEKEITKLNILLEYIENDLLICTLTDLVSNDAGTVITGAAREKKWPKERVWTSSLLCGPDTIIVAAVNHIPATLPGPPQIEPAKDVTITVKLPDFLTSVKAFEVTEDGFTPFDHTAVDGNAVLKVDSIESGRVFLLRRK